MEGIIRLPHLHSTPFSAAAKVEETERDRGGLVPWHGIIETINTGDMTICCNESDDDDRTAIANMAVRSTMCPSCGHNIQLKEQARINELPGLPAGVKFDPNDQEILEHLEAKVVADVRKLHPLIDEFIPTIEGENGICCTHPEKLPGLSKDGQIRHFFHRPSKAYTTGTRKRRKVHNDSDGSETRWHKTGKTRPVLINGTVKGFKKILVLYTNYGRQRKPEKTNWVMHQYHLGNNEEEKDGELVVSKIFYQTQPRQCGSATKDTLSDGQINLMMSKTTNNNVVEYYNPSYISYGGHAGHIKEASHPHLSHPHGVLQGDGSSFLQFAPDLSKEK